MKVSNFMPKVFGRKSKTTRDRVTYRAIRRNVARISYRRAKKEQRV